MTIRGFRSIHELVDYCPGDMNLLIGANGSGKSNLIAFFRMMSWMMTGKLATHVSSNGGASKLLHDGPARTREISGEISIATENGDDNYTFRLVYASSGDSLLFTEEKYRFVRHEQDRFPWTDLGAGHRESLLQDAADGPAPGNRIAKFILSLLKGCRVYQFHNTSDTARLKQKWHINDSRFLKEDGGNLAPVLLRMREHHPENYRQVVEHCRDLLPFFDDFVLEPDSNHVLLQWSERGSDLHLDASAASDGMLRIIALVTLLCQPRDQFFDVLFLDEPELGLHPAAIELVAGLLKSFAAQTQVFAATQSPLLLNHFPPSDVTVVERDGRASTFRRLSEPDLEEWLEEYTLSELWQKNVIGGRPG